MATITPPRLEGPGRLERLARWSQRHHWMAIGLWVAVLVGVTAFSQVVGTDYHDDYSLPGTESQELTDTFSRYAPAQAGDSIQVVLHDEAGLDSTANRDRVNAMLAKLSTRPHVTGITNPFESEGAISADGTIGYAMLTLDASTTDIPRADIQQIIKTAQAAISDGLEVELGGDPVRAAEEAPGGAAEGAGMLAALVILVFMFGSFLAASLPLITAIFAVGSTIGVIALLSHVVTVATYTPPLMMLVGLGVGIDYALLIFARYRGELLAGAERQTAARTALDTAGRSVIFAGCTVIIALMGLYALGLGSLQSIALAVALTVLVTMAASLTLLPSLLRVFGRRIERRIKRRAQRAKHEHGYRWRRLSDAVQRRPLPALLAAVVLLLALAAPALSMRLGFADAGNDGTSTTSRQAYDLLADGFGPGFNGPLVVMARGTDAQGTISLRETLAATPGVAGTTPPQSLPGTDIATMLVFPDRSPQDDATSELVTDLRSDVLPQLAERTGASYLVGGSTAAAEDFSRAVSDRLPLFITVVVGLSALLLMAVFRSIWIPVKAAVLNLLSIGAAMGVVTLVFGGGMFGVPAGPVEAFVPVLIFAIVFGLSMDYEVFLMSRMHEQWRRTGDAVRAVREGLATTGGVITAAAAIMVVVFGAFVLSPSRMLQQFGLGLAVAVFLDAVVIRCLIVPAVMRLLGRHAWWLPNWLERVLPRIPLERTAVAQVSEPVQVEPAYQR